VPAAFDQWGLFAAESPLTLEERLSQMPISEAAQAEFLRLLTTEEDQIPDIALEDKRTYLSSISYRDFLTKHLRITEPDVFAVLQDLTADLGLGIEAVDAYLALTYAGMPGWDAAGLADPGFFEPYIHHFPDGNASIARLLVRSMIPDVAPGNTMEDIVLARFDYSRLDQDTSQVRIRLNSTVTNVEHDGDPSSAERTNITYIRDGQAYRVQARACVLACNNSIIPYLCPGLPDAQNEALANQVKQPLLHTNVALRNWHAWKKLGITAVSAPGSYHTGVMLDFPVSLGDYGFSGGPDEPIVVDMYRTPHVNNRGLTAKEQWRLARYELLSTPFEDIERNVRSQLNGMLGEAGFDPATDIMGITVNRWSHGYAYEHHFHALFDDDYDDVNDSRYPHVQARKRYGRIAIANSDAGAMAMVEGAVEQAHRAATELLSI
jgi:spermidine dehydrogenase